MVGNLPDQVRFHDHLAMMRKTILLMLLKCSLSIRRIATIRYQKDAKRECQRGNDAVYWPYKEFSKNISFKTAPCEQCLDIRDEMYFTVRTELTELGRHASEWIPTYFLELDDVTASSRDQFLDLMSTWKHDQCHGP